MPVCIIPLMDHLCNSVIDSNNINAHTCKYSILSKVIQNVHLKEKNFPHPYLLFCACQNELSVESGLSVLRLLSSGF